MVDKNGKPGLTLIKGEKNTLVREAFNAILRSDSARFEELMARIERNPPELTVIAGRLAEPGTPVPGSQTPEPDN